MLLTLTIGTSLALGLIDIGLKNTITPRGIVSFEFCGFTASCEAALMEWRDKGQALAMLSLGLDYLYMVLYSGLITKLIHPTQKEQGCINYDLHEDNSNDAMFMFHETWGSEDDLNAHSQSSHIKKCFEIMGGMLVSTEVLRLTKVNV